MEICAIIYEPRTGGAPREFVVSSTTRDGTASKRLKEEVLLVMKVLSTLYQLQVQIM